MNVRLLAGSRGQIRGFQALCLVGMIVACLPGCLVPQDTAAMSPTPTLNRPPLFDLSGILPRAPSLSANVNPLCPSAPEFSVEIIDLDVEQAVAARWFWDYDLDGDDPAQAPVRTQLLQPTGSPYRQSARLDPSDLLALFPEPGVHVLEVFIAEQDALELDSSVAPRWRAVRDCAGEGYPEGCVPTSPSLFRWAVSVEDVACP